jgi:hypothetical protein
VVAFVPLTAAPVTEANVQERISLFMHNCKVGDLCDRLHGKPGPGRCALGMSQPFFVEEFLLLGQARQGNFSCFGIALQPVEKGDVLLVGPQVRCVFAARKDGLPLFQRAASVLS